MIRYVTSYYKYFNVKYVMTICLHTLERRTAGTPLFDTRDEIHARLVRTD